MSGSNHAAFFGGDRDTQRLFRAALVAPRLKVLYMPTTKAACTTITMMVSQAEASHRPDLADRVMTNHLSPHQTIHAASVNGLLRLAQLPERRLHDVLTSPDWLRLTSIRGPLSRVYSAWENRLLLRAPGFARRLADRAPDVVTGLDGHQQLDLTATFANFVRAFADHTDDFMRDHHFMTQTRFIRPDLIDYDMVVRVDTPGALDDLAAVLTARSKASGTGARDVTPQRLNEGLGIPLARVCTAADADVLMSRYGIDYDTFGFSQSDARAALSSQLSPYVLSATETRLLRQLRGSIQRSLDIADATRLRRRAGFRAMRTIYAVVHKVSRRHVAIPQRFM